MKLTSHQKSKRYKLENRVNDTNMVLRGIQ